MKIGIDCRLWNETGVGRYIRNLVENLQKIDKVNDYVLFVQSQNVTNVNSIIFNSKFSISNCDIKWHSLQEQIEFPKILKSAKLDIMHFTYFSVPIFYNKPFIVTIHDLILDHFPTGKASTLPKFLYYLKLISYRLIMKHIAFRAKRIIAVSNTTKQEIRDHLKVKSEKITVTYEGVDVKLNEKFKIKNLKLKIQEPYFLYVGNAYPHKNLERLVQAFQLLSAQHKNIQLVLVGKEDFFYSRLKKVVKSVNLSDSVLFCQQVTDSELSTLYQHALALVYPSLMEGFGLPAIEAMSMNCLVLVADIPVFREICQNAALYFDPYDMNDLAAKMQLVLESGKKQFTDKLELGLAKTKEFSWEKMAEETLRIYQHADVVS